MGSNWLNATVPTTAQKDDQPLQRLSLFHSVVLFIVAAWGAYLFSSLRNAEHTALPILETKSVMWLLSACALVSGGMLMVRALPNRRRMLLASAYIAPALLAMTILDILPAVAPDFFLPLNTQWPSFAIRMAFAVLILLGVKSEKKSVRPDGTGTISSVLWGVIIALLAILSLRWLLLPDQGIALGAALHAEEIVPMLFLALAFIHLLRLRTWNTDNALFGVMCSCLLLFATSVFLLFAAAGQPLVAGAYTIALLSVVAPMLTTLSAMAVAYYLRERYRVYGAPVHLGSIGQLPVTSFREIFESMQTQAALTDNTGRILVHTSRLRTSAVGEGVPLIGRTPALWQHSSIAQSFYPTVFADIQQSKRVFTTIVKSTRPGLHGAQYDAAVTITPICNDVGEIVCCLFEQRDLTVEQQQLALLKHALDTQALGMVLVEGSSYDITLINARGEYLLGRAAFDLSALRRWEDIAARLNVGDGREPTTTLPRRALDTGSTCEVDGVALYIGDDKEPAMVWKVSATPLIGAVNDRRYVLIIFDDISHHQEYAHHMADFVSVASHQLRTPLANIRWSLDALSAVQNLSPEHVQALQTMSQATGHMASIVEKLLQLAESENNNGDVARPVQLLDVLIGAVQMLQPTIDAKRINLKQSVLKTPPVVHCNPFLIQQIVENLLTNAVCYTPEGGDVDSIVAVNNESIEWTLHDTGIGISRVDQGRIFEKFFRSDAAQRMHPDGSGLGLSITKTSIEQMGGSIRFESEEGHGTTMYVTLPIVMKKKR